MIKAVLFDLDGTLLNTLDDLAASVAYAMKAMGLTPVTRDQVRQFVGNGARALCEKCLGKGAEAAAVDRLQALFQDHYKDHLHDVTAPYPGVMDMLKALRAMGVKRGVVSNKFSAATQAVCDLYFGDLIDVVVGEGPGVRKKPAPDSLLAVMDRLGVSPEACAMVGDSPQDILAAKAAGCLAVGVTWGFRSRAQLEEAGADVIVDAAEELLNLAGGLRLVKVNADNFYPLMGLTVEEGQRDFVASNAYSLAEAYAVLSAGRYVQAFGLYDGAVPVGFAMIGHDVFTDVDCPPAYKGSYYLWRYMIDARYQRRGYGRQGVELLLDFIRAFPDGLAKTCAVSCEPENAVAKRLYESFGFRFTGEMDGDEEIAVLKL